MTPAEKFIAAKYEAAVDAGLDVGAIQRYLKDHGINRTLAAVVHDLDNVFMFTGYAATHPAPADDVAEFDRRIDSTRYADLKNLPDPVQVGIVATTKRSYNECNSRPPTGTRP